jgi:hypothetical protein
MVLAHGRFTTLRTGLSAGLPFTDALDRSGQGPQPVRGIIFAIPFSIIKVHQLNQTAGSVCQIPGFS